MYKDLLMHALAAKRAVDYWDQKLAAEELEFIVELLTGANDPKNYPTPAPLHKD